MAVLGIHHAALVVPDLQKALDFYCGVLGFEVVQTGPIEPTTYAEEITQLEKPKAMGKVLKSGWGYLEIWEFENPVDPEEQFFWTPVNTYGIRHICLLVDNAVAAYGYLKDHMIFHGEPVIHSVEGPENEAWTAYGRDPFGNVLELWQIGPKDPKPYAPEVLPHPEVKTDDKPVSKHGILGIHHIALVVPDLQKAVDFYTDVLGFEKGQYGPIEPSSYAEVHTQLKQPSADSFDLRSGWGYLEIWEYKNPIDPEPQDKNRPCNKFGFAHFSVMVDDCFAEYERLKEHMTFHREPVEHSVEGEDNVAVTTYGRDPFGNIIELWQIGSSDPQPFAPEVIPHSQ